MAHHSTTECNDLPVKTVSTERGGDDIKFIKGDDLQEFHFKEKNCLQFSVNYKTILLTLIYKSNLFMFKLFTRHDVEAHIQLCS